jgi:hypothetical protein
MWRAVKDVYLPKICETLFADSSFHQMKSRSDHDVDGSRCTQAFLVGQTGL